MENDRLENRNLAARPEQKAVLASLRKQYDAWLGVWEKEGVENNGYCTADLFEGGIIRLQGYRKQQKYDWGLKK